MAGPRTSTRLRVRRDIVLGKAALAGDAVRPPRAPHWRRWRRGGTALSALLHVLVLAAFTVSLPRPNLAQRDIDRALPVEIVKPEAPKEPEKEKEKEKAKEPEKKSEPQKAETPPKIEPPKEVPKIETAKPETPKMETPKTEPPSAEPPKTATPAQPQEPRAPSSPAKSLAQPEQRPSPPLASPAPPPQPPTFAELMPRSPPPPRAIPPAPQPGPSGGQIVSADDDSAPPDPKKVVGYWVLDPLTVDLRHRCGLARITATMVLTERIAEGHYRGTLRNRVVWASCEPTGALYHVEMRINGANVQVIGAEGFTDRGVVRGNVMMLEDAYGRSVWRKR